jgi:hypothetical protein
VLLKVLVLRPNVPNGNLLNLPTENVVRHKEITDELAKTATSYPQGTRMPAEVAEKVVEVDKGTPIFGIAPLSAK